MPLDLELTPDANPHPLDSVVAATTALPTWDDLVTTMGPPERPQYTPTVYPDTRRKRILRRALHASGYRPYPFAR